MRKTFITITIAIIAVLAGFAFPCIAPAAPDQFIGDTAIYGGQAAILQPNILIIIDDSGSMSGLVPGGSYDPVQTYAVTNHCSGNCSADAVYTTNNGGSSGSLLNASINNITTSCNGRNPQSILQTLGIYSGRRLNTDGTCRFSGNATYVMGNYINWYHSSTGMKPKIQIARDVITNLLNSTSGVKFGLMRFHYPTNDYNQPSGAEGAELFTASLSGNTYVTTIKDMEAIFFGATTNRDALVAAVATLTARGYTPLGESQFEAMRYFQGGATAFGNTVGTSGGLYTSPIEYSCQKNYIIFVTDGIDTASNSAVVDLASATYGRYDGGGCANPPYTTCANDRSHSLSGIAKYMYEHDLKTGATLTTAVTQNNVITYTIGFGLGGADQEAVDLLKLTADSNHGRGKDFLAGSEAELSAAISTVIAEINSVDQSFVAPVVPVNPENKTQEGSRIYMGFFKPEDVGSWSGNLKKFGLNASLDVVDSNNNLATYVDSNGDGLDDRDSSALSADANAINGSFRSSVISYWSTTVDGGTVKRGGTGDKLLARVNALSISSTTANIAGANPRNIYTYTGGATDLTNAANAFLTQSVDSGAITAAMLGLPGAIISTATTTDMKQLINYIHGFDVYSSVTASTTQARAWIMGDVLHSKPTVIRYASFDYAQETSCGVNTSIIYVGTNDGMLHAFKDCDGSEAWAFIPPDVLANLQYLKGPNHTYFVDSTIQYYKSPSTDAVVLLMGLRRGGGVTDEPNQGFYYALDVTNPLAPKYLWKVSPTASFTDLGEAWSEPKMVKVNIGGVANIVAFFGGGYDDCNEDGRYGSTGRFSGTCVNGLATSDGGLDGGGLPITSSPHTITPLGGFTSAQYKGRALYAVQIATLSANGQSASIAGSLNLIWSATYAAGSPLEYSMVSELLALSTQGTGYADRLYMGDTGGNMWRVNLSSTTPSAWTITKIFNSNPGYTGYPAPVSDGSRGRKIFYKPDGFIDATGVVRLYFGTGDREHPLNRAVTDRLYGLVDKGQAGAVSEANLIDVTTDQIQAGSQSVVDDVLAQLTKAGDPADTTVYGWYIQLNGADVTPYVQYPGEKVLAGAAVAGGAVYFTTYSPSSQQSLDPCQLGNLGSGSLFAVDPKLGSAVANFDTSNDGLYSSYSGNKYAVHGNDVLLRTDRRKNVGQSIASGPVVLFPPKQTCTTPPCPPPPPVCERILVGGGRGLSSNCGSDTPPRPVEPIYWRMR